jgi:tetratricopeptide (TPR) repeat protein
MPPRLLTVTRALAVIVVAAAVAGCAQDKPDAPRSITYSKDIAPILFANCASCHRPVDLTTTLRAVQTTGLLSRPAASETDPICVAGAPFSVLDYASVRRRAPAIASAVQRRAMPPWLPERGHGEFEGERRLGDDQIALIQQWVAAGAPEGDPADAPAPPAFADGWQLGTPDLVLTLPEPYELKPFDSAQGKPFDAAQGKPLDSAQGDVFRNFVIPVPGSAFKGSTPRYVRGVEFRADRPQALHHADVALDLARVSRALDRADPGPGFATMDSDAVHNVYGWSPGKVPVLEPAEHAWTLDPGADLVLLLHMIAGTDAQTVRPMIGLFFSDTPPTRTPISVKLESKAIDIPAGDANYVVEASYVLPVDVETVSVYPHAHYLGKEMRATATLPDGSQRSLIWIRQWDFRWQDRYRYRSPVLLPQGTRLSMRFTYDNSASNPNNRQRSPQRVKAGPRSTDEMASLWLEVVPRRPEDAARLNADFVRRMIDANIEGAELNVRIDPRSAAARNQLAILYLQVRRAAEALAQLEEALRLDPRDAEVHSNLGTVLQAQGRIAEGTEHLRSAVRLAPKDDRVRFNLGSGLLAAGQDDAAMREFETALRLNPDNADAHFNLAVILGPRNRLDEAIVHLTRVVELTPRNGNAYRNLALAYALQRKIDQAIPAAQAAVRLQPDSAEVRTLLDRLLATRGGR